MSQKQLIMSSTYYYQLTTESMMDVIGVEWLGKWNRWYRDWMAFGGCEENMEDAFQEWVEFSGVDLDIYDRTGVMYTRTEYDGWCGVIVNRTRYERLNGFVAKRSVGNEPWLQDRVSVR